MNLCATFFAPSCFKVISLVETPDHFLLDLKTVSKTALCPLCQKPSKRIRSVYTRLLSDLPIIVKRLKIRLLVRRFYCDNTSCKRRIFCERVPQLASAYARCSSRLIHAHLHIALASGGETGALLAKLLGMPSSPDTLLRRIIRFLFRNSAFDVRCRADGFHQFRIHCDLLPALYRGLLKCCVVFVILV